MTHPAGLPTLATLPEPSRCAMLLLALAIMVAGVAGIPSGVDAEPIAVRFDEGPTYALVVLSSATSGEVLADGELLQTAAGRRTLRSRLTFRFKDGSLSDETVVFSQDKVFRVVSYHLVQRGRSFPHEMEVGFDRASGRYRVRYKEHAQAAEERLEGTTDMPSDLYNGMGSTLIRNLEGRRAEGHLLAFTPKPRLLRMEFTPNGEDSFEVGGAARTARRYLMKLEVPGVIGVLASAVGKDPPDVSYWISTPSPPS